MAHEFEELAIVGHSYPTGLEHQDKLSFSWITACSYSPRGTDMSTGQFLA
jgi:hypothetical protein